MTSVGLIGPGAIGCVLLGALVEAGVDVVVGARTPFSSVEVRHPDGVIRRPVTVVTEPGDRAPFDVVVLATKTYQTQGAAPFLEAWCGPDTAVAVAQNGVEHRERVQPLVGSAAVVPVVVACPAVRRAPGDVDLTGAARLSVPDDAASRRVAALFEPTIVEVSCLDDWLTMSWLKLLTNCAGGAVTTLTRRSNEVYGDPDAAELILALMAEVVEVGVAEGARLTAETPAQVLELVRARAGHHVSSITADRIAGRPTEWRERNEVVERKAAAYGIDVPLNRAMTTLIKLGEPE